VKLTTEELADRQILLTIVVEEERSRAALRQAARRLSHRMRIPGFRPGKAPYAIVLRTLGEDYLRAEAFEAIGQKLYEEALETAEIEAYAQGSLDDVQWDPLTLKVTIPLPPVVELGDYRTLRVTPEPILVLDEDVAEALQALRERYAEWVPEDRPAGYGDMLIMDIRGVVGDEEIMNQQNWERVLREDSGSGLPGFDAALVGHRPGESLAFDLVYPDDSTRWAGEPAHFEATLHGVKVKELPPLDDEFAQTTGDFDTLDALRESTRDRLRAEREAEEDYEGKVLDSLVGQATIEYPPFLVERELDGIMEEHDRLLQQQGMPLEDYLRVSGKTSEEYRDENRPRAVQRLERSLALGEFVKREDMSMEDEAVDEEIRRRVERQPQESSERLRTLLEAPGAREALRNDLLTRQALLRLQLMARGEYEEDTTDLVEEQSNEVEDEGTGPTDEVLQGAE
jgi:trigger factor